MTSDFLTGSLEPIRIKVIGVGGGGGNAVEHMIDRGVHGVEFICANTDAQALQRSSASTLLQLGKTGLGAGSRPEAGRQAAEEAEQDIRRAIEGAHLLFITAGMGGGTGTGAAPVIARVAREMGILTVGVVTKPFAFEGRRRALQAEQGVAELEGFVDSLIVVLNERLLDQTSEETTLDQAFALADEVLKDAVNAISELIHTPGLVNVDFEDVRTVMSEPGRALMGSARASGPDRAVQAAQQALNGPLLEGVELHSARGLLVCMAASRGTFKLAESRQAMDSIRRRIDENAHVIYGAAYDESLGAEMRVTVIATGLHGATARPEAPHLSQIIPVLPPPLAANPAAAGVFGAGGNRRRSPPSSEAIGRAVQAGQDSKGEDRLEMPGFLRRQAGDLFGASPPPPPPSREAVHFGVTAPRLCRPGSEFNAVLSVYVESARARAAKQLRRTGGPLAKSLLDLPPQRQSGWVVGAPVTVRLQAAMAEVSPPEQSFEWNGSVNLAAFVVKADPALRLERGAELNLCFSVALAGVPIAFIPLPVPLAEDASETDAQMPPGVAAPGLAFASYASKDAETVGHCLSALSRWSPGFRCYQDCLDLRPGESFKAEIRSCIESSERFILFWSRHASASPWVRWEYDTARATKGLDAVIPMPLEDPALAPPPPEFAHRHMRDRFMMARYAMQRISDLGAQGPPG